MNPINKSQAIILLFVSLLFYAGTASAGSPDGLGQWADTVISYHQGLTKNGLRVPKIQSNPQAALGVSEHDTDPSHSYSLGFEGNIVFWFNNWISDGSFLVDSNYPDYAGETAVMEVSENGTTWIWAGEIPPSGIVSMPAGINCAKFVRITGSTDPGSFPDQAEGYDINGIEAIGDSCNPASAEPRFPNTGTTGTIDASGASSITSPLVPDLPNTGIIPADNATSWKIMGNILLSLAVIYLAWRSYKFLSHR